MAFTLLQGCGKIRGDYYANQAPSVQIVNVPQNAADSTLTQQNGMPFSIPDSIENDTVYIAILSMQGTTMMPGSEKVYANDPNSLFRFGQDYDVVYGASWTDTVRLSNQTIQLIAHNNVQGALRILPTPPGSMLRNTTYHIDFRFNVENYYVFSYAPTLHWVGYDGDGFIDRYYYADVTDQAFITEFKIREDLNPPTHMAYYAANQHNPAIFVWHDTTAMQARIYLLTEAGETTEHLFFVKAVDNGSANSSPLESQPDYKTFYRSNNPPNNPQIKQLLDPETSYALNYLSPDTLFSLDEITANWEGISFNWKSNDPDDKSLYKIPLQYSYFVIKAPGDTLWAWSDSTWTETNQVQLCGLASGSYVLSVWCRDDAYTQCAQSANAFFNVVKATFEHHILVIDETYSGIFLYELGPPPTFPPSYADSLNKFWIDLLTDLQGELDNDNYVMDGVDVYFKDNSNPNADPAMQANPIAYALIGKYKLVLIYHDSHGGASTGVLAQTYRINRDKVLADYLDVGGRLWYEGRNLLAGSFGKALGPAAISSTEFLGAYMQLEYGSTGNMSTSSYTPEFIGGNPSIPGFPTVIPDSNRVKMVWWSSSFTNRRIMPEVDWFNRSDQAVALYTFNSITANPPDTTYLNEDSPVAAGATPVHCAVTPLHSPILEVFEVKNVTRSVIGQIESFNPTSIQVSYPFGQPWRSSDTLQVDYRYNRISVAHLKPVAVRYENQRTVLQYTTINGVQVPNYVTTLGYRTSIFGFPFYFMKNDQGQVKDLVKEMLNWFFYPGLHYNI
jgi:hypothetical protein